MNEFEKRSDFHAHITSEENALSLIDKAIDTNISSLALIGRGVLPDNVYKITNKAKNRGIDLHFGIEDIFSINGQRKDFIIFDIDPNNKKIKDMYSQAKLRESSLKVLHKQISFLESEALQVEAYDQESEIILNKLLAGEIYEKAITLCGLVCSNSLNQKSLERLWSLYGEQFAKQYSESSFDLTRPTPKFIWWLYFTVGRPGYFNSEQNPELVAKIVHETGGLFIFSPESDEPDQEITEVLDEKDYIDGVMGWHGDRLSISRNTIRWLRNRNKVIFGGSDYNPLRDGESDQWLVGVGKGEMLISPKRFVRELRHLR